MIIRFTSPVAFAVVAALAIAPAYGAVRQDKSMTVDEIVDTIKAAPGCDASMKIFSDRQLGSSGDIRLCGAAQEKCEADFLPKLKEPEKHIYQRELRTCSREYANQLGTMYRSFKAFCVAEVAQRYSHKALKLGQPRSTRP